jgi:hypothetical protein
VNVLLDVAIGVVFLYLSLALVITTVQELISTVMRSRARSLYDAIEGMLPGTVDIAEQGKSGPETKKQKLIAEFYEHPLIQNLLRNRVSFGGGAPSFRTKLSLPSYIPSKTFATALLDVLRGDKSPSQIVGARKLIVEANQALDRLSDSNLKRALGVWLKDTGDASDSLDKQAEVIGDGIETWFNDRMARASGWYKRRAQLVSLGLALALAIATNADTIHVASRLFNDANLRASIAASAQAYHEAELAKQSAGEAPKTNPGATEASSTPDVKGAFQAVVDQSKQLQAIQFPIGWFCDGEPPTKGAATPASAEAQCHWFGGRNLGLVAIGWLVTALAVSLGANFWFDILGKALQIRGSGPKVSVATGEVEKKGE